MSFSTRVLLARARFLASDKLAGRTTSAQAKEEFRHLAVAQPDGVTEEELREAYRQAIRSGVRAGRTAPCKGCGEEPEAGPAAKESEAETRRKRRDRLFILAKRVAGSQPVSMRPPAGPCGHGPEVGAKEEPPLLTIHDPNAVRLHLGCGTELLKGYVNIDIRSIPHGDGQAFLQADCADPPAILRHTKAPLEIRAFDFFEHIPHPDRWRVLEGWCDALRLGGILDFTVPNLDFLINRYNSGQVDFKKFVEDLYGEQDYPENRHLSAYHADELRRFLLRRGFRFERFRIRRNIHIRARKHRKRILWITNGGMGDAAMAVPGLARLIEAGFEVDTWMMRGNARLMNSVLSRMERVRALGEKPEGETYWAVCCPTRSDVLKRRAEGLDYEHLLTTTSWRGSCATWATNIANQLAPGNAHYNCLRGALPKPRTPKAIVIAAGTANREPNDQKRWPGWTELLQRISGRVVLVGAADAAPELPPPTSCPRCAKEASHIHFDRGEPEEFDVTVPLDRFECECGWFVEVENLCGRTPNLGEDLLEVFSDASLCVTVDNGVGHVAALCGVPMITIFGITPPGRFKPHSYSGVALGSEKCFPTVREVAGRVEASQGRGLHLRSPLLTVLIGSHNEGEELLLTVESSYLMSGCPTQVLVADDHSDDGSADRLPEACEVVKVPGEHRRGVAPGRMAAMPKAKGDALTFLDGHMRFMPDGAGRELAEKAIQIKGLVIGISKNLYGSENVNYGSYMWIDPGRNRLVSNFHKTRPSNRYREATGFVAPGYVIDAEVFRRLGGWPSALRGWGQTEITLSTMCWLAGVPMLLDRDNGFYHLFRSRFHYSVRVSQPLHNQFVLCRHAFDEATNEQFWFPFLGKHRYSHIKGWQSEWTKEDEAASQAFKAQKVRPDEEFFRVVLGMSLQEAKGKFL